MFSFNSKWWVLASSFGDTCSGCCNIFKISLKYESFSYFLFNSSLSINCVLIVLILARCVWQESASATILSLPGLYLTSKSFACRVSNQWACLFDKLFCVLIYSSEAWSVITVNFWSSRYGFHNLIACIIASNSFSWIE